MEKVTNRTPLSSWRKIDYSPKGKWRCSECHGVWDGSELVHHSGSDGDLWLCPNYKTKGCGKVEEDGEVRFVETVSRSKHGAVKEKKTVNRAEPPELPPREMPVAEPPELPPREMPVVESPKPSFKKPPVVKGGRWSCTSCNAVFSSERVFARNGPTGWELLSKCCEKPVEQLLDSETA